MIQYSLSRAFALGGLAVWMALAGCAPAESVVGQVEVTLQGAAPDGSIYRLPPGSFLLIQDDARFGDMLFLDDDVAVYSKALPVGSYTWTLEGSSDSTEWALERQDPSGNVETVLATLVNAQPESFQISADATTSLTLQFEAKRGGSITFAQGTVEVSLGITEVSTLGGNALWQATGLVAQHVMTTESTPPALLSRLPAEGATEYVAAVSASVIGNWAQESITAACAPVAIVSWSAGSPTDDVTGTGFEGLMLETDPALGGAAEICVEDSGATNIVLARTGAPSTATFSDLGAADLKFYTVITADLPAGAFDGQTIDLSLLSGTISVVGHAQQSVVDLTAGALWYAATYDGSADFAFTPTDVP